MALFGGARDVSVFRHVNRELLGNVITQQCALYKFSLEQTTVNMYGEASEGKFLEGPYLFNSLITVNDNTSPVSELGVDFDWGITAAFLRDDLVIADVHPEVGDIILYQESYFEIDNTNETQYFVGKNPDFPYGPNPLNSGLENFGYNVSVICTAHYVPADKYNIIKQRL
jgi:hypothetical protein